MFRHIAAFEARYQFRSPVFWVGCLIFFLLTFAAATVDQIQIGSLGNVHKNAPFALLQTAGIMNVFGVFIVVAMVAGVVLRDDETGFAPILRSTPVGKLSYLVGRFAGALLAAWVVMAAVPLAVALGSQMPWQDAEKIGPLHLADYAYTLFLFTLPTMLITGAVFFAVATATRSMMWTHVAAVGVLVAYLATRGLLRDPAHDTVAGLLDPFGMSTLGIITRYWTASERNTLLPPLQGLMLWNRLLWAGIALLVFAAACWRFRVATPTPAAAPAPSARSQRRAAAAQARRPLPAMSAAARTPLPEAPPADAAVRRAQWLALARHDMAFVFRSPAFFVLMAIGLLNAGASLWMAGDRYGAGAWPVTRLMVQALDGAYAFIPLLMAVFYSSELVWRDRERRMHELIDATPAPDAAHLLPKILATCAALLAAVLAGVVAGVVVQAIRGGVRFELMHYLAWFIAPLMLHIVELVVLATFVQVLVPHKYIGWGLMLLQVVASVSLASAGFEHNLYHFNATSPAPISDFNGMDRFWVGMLWFHAYWLACSAVLLLLSYGLWRRGATTALRPRLARLGLRLRGTPRLMLGGALLVWLGTGLWIFHNTNQLNRYLPGPRLDDLQAEAEKQLLPFESVPQPRIASVQLDVQLYPQATRAVTTGTYRLVNRTAAPIDVIHLGWDFRTRMDRVDLPGATLQKDYGDFHYRIYRLATPLAPGATLDLGFQTTLEERGFPNDMPLTRIVSNGTFLNNSEIAPGLGFSRDSLLQDRAKRRKHGLPPELRMPKLEDDSARAFNELRADSDWVTADITVTTDADQTPIAPGETRSDRIVSVGGPDGVVQRHQVHFVTDAPINHFFSVQSGRWAVARDRVALGANNVDLAVYHLPAHAWNVDRMMTSMKLSLQLFNEQFSPYQFHQARIIEFPGYASFAQSFANTIPYSEDIGFLGRYTGDPEKVDLATYVTAHEVAHQWWGHQLLPARQQGGSMLVESFAQYSALLVMEKVYGRDQVRRFLKYELDRYLRSRGGELVEELPLARVENQGYIHYQKGALAMYWLRDVLGETAVNRVMSRFVREHAFKDAPYPNTRDFLALLRAEAGPQHEALITDLFEKITLLDLKASNAKATKRADGKWDLAFDIEARKLYASGQGVETEAPMDELVELGVFTAQPGKKGFGSRDVLVLEKRRVTTGKQTLHYVLDREPQWAGIDPYNKRIDRNSDDNLVQVSAP